MSSLPPDDPKSRKLRRSRRHLDFVASNELTNSPHVPCPSQVMEEKTVCSRMLRSQTPSKNSFAGSSQKTVGFEKASALYSRNKRTHSHMKEQQASASACSIQPTSKSKGQSQKFLHTICKPGLDSAGREISVSRKRKNAAVTQKNKIGKYICSVGSKSSSEVKSKVNDTSPKSLSGGFDFTVLTPANVAKIAPETEYFGLFGASGEYEEDFDGPNHFERLPVEVLEQILCQLPLWDLLSCRTVCQLFKDIISSEKFIHWKLTYYKLKHGCLATEHAMHTLFNSIGGTDVKNCLEALIRFMNDGFVCKPAHDIHLHLKKHKKYVTAERVIAKSLKWLESKPINPWCIVALIILLSEDLSEVEDVFHLLLKSQSVTDALNIMYCIATLLFYCKIVFKTNSGLHYHVFYTLHLFENEIGMKPINSEGTRAFFPGQQSLHRYCSPLVQKLSCEQLQIVNHRFKRTDVIKVVAFAGTGKTSTLVELARRYPQVKFLNIMFNKSGIEYAQTLFPENVECRTSHSLAFGDVGKLYSHKLAKKVSAAEFKQWLGIDHYPFDSIVFCKCVYHTVKNFVSSADAELVLKHVPVKKISIGASVLLEEERIFIFRAALTLWKNMIDQSKEGCKIWHDVYLKLYQLEKPKLKQYQCIMVDEAQDCNFAILDIVMSQNIPVVLVGDPNQQIYAFRGSKNALVNVRCTHIYHLTQSFRFGPKIAYVASCCLEVLKGNHQSTLVGSRKDSTTIGEVRGQYGVIARTNCGLFMEVVRLCCQNNLKIAEEPTKIFGAFAGGIASYGWDKLLDIYNLKENSGNSKATPKDGLIKSFSSFFSLKDFAEKNVEADLLSKIQLVEKFEHMIPEYVNKINKNCQTSLELANVVFSTAHKAKGLEFDTVYLADDFSIGSSAFIENDMAEEYNILYVALTRAKKSLVMSPSLMNVLQNSQEKFEYPIWSSDALNGSSDYVCVICEHKYEPTGGELILKRRQTCLSDGHTMRGGLLCGHCAQNMHYRPHVVRNPTVMFLDPMPDHAHSSMQFILGPPTGKDPSSERINMYFPPFRFGNEIIYVIDVL